MQTEMASQAILARLKSMSDEDPPAVSLSQIKLWVMPQKGEHDHDYSFNQSYFETLLAQAVSDLLAKGYIASSLHDGVEDGDAQIFFLTKKGSLHLDELEASAGQ